MKMTHVDTFNLILLEYSSFALRTSEKSASFMCARTTKSWSKAWRTPNYSVFSSSLNRPVVSSCKQRRSWSMRGFSNVCVLSCGKIQISAEFRRKCVCSIGIDMVQMLQFSAVSLKQLPYSHSWVVKWTRNLLRITVLQPVATKIILRDNWDLHFFIS